MIPNPTIAGRTGRRYTGSRAWSAEGARIATVTCLRCGAALIIDPADDFVVMEIHDNWHAKATGTETT